jgi:hypothetical protein
MSYISKYSCPYLPLGGLLLCSFPFYLCLFFLALHFLNPVDNPKFLVGTAHTHPSHKSTRFIWIVLLPRRLPFKSFSLMWKCSSPIGLSYLYVFCCLQNTHLDHPPIALLIEFWSCRTTPCSWPFPCFHYDRYQMLLGLDRIPKNIVWELF